MIHLEQWIEPSLYGCEGSYELVGVICSRPLGSSSEWMAVAEAITARKKNTL